MRQPREAIVESRGARDGELAPTTPFGTLPASLQPHPNLLKYYVLSSLAAGPFFAFVLVPMYFRYRTLRYEVDDEGITARWGILFRREISLTYARIQDIHLASNVVERWLGLARIHVQTASGSSSAEMTIQGMPQYGAIRDFLYSRMRGARDRAITAPGQAGGADGGAAALPALVATELADALLEITQELRSLREALAVGPAGPEERETGGGTAAPEEGGRARG